MDINKEFGKVYNEIAISNRNCAALSGACLRNFQRIESKNWWLTLFAAAGTVIVYKMHKKIKDLELRMEELEETKGE